MRQFSYLSPDKAFSDHSFLLTRIDSSLSSSSSKSSSPAFSHATLSLGRGEIEENDTSGYMSSVNSTSISISASSSSSSNDTSEATSKEAGTVYQSLCHNSKTLAMYNTVANEDDDDDDGRNM
uniref:Uncharacterized protein n=1 Tax=Lygus hesperus TaxID=30085 RepID=A0A0A9YW73_LYGHE